MVGGYSAPDSTTWHRKMNCSGKRFSPAEEMDSKAAAARGRSPCGNCCPDGWPHDDDDGGVGVSLEIPDDTAAVLAALDDVTAEGESMELAEAIRYHQDDRMTEDDYIEALTATSAVAYKFYSPRWHGPEYHAYDGEHFVMYPLGSSRHVGQYSEDELRNDLSTGHVRVTPMPSEETPLEGVL
jgi:hypothetical protein